MMNKNKKGAIEMSMNTIIVIVIGVTLLILGLAFVRTTFTKVTDLTSGAFDKAEGQIGVDANLDYVLNVIPPKLSVLIGGTKTTTIVVANKEDKDATNVKITVNSVTGAKLKSDDIECIFIESGDASTTVDTIQSGRFKRLEVRIKSSDTGTLGDKACKFTVEGIGKQKETGTVFITVVSK